jgi:hypothetical protein
MRFAAAAALLVLTAGCQQAGGTPGYTPRSVSDLRRASMLAQVTSQFIAGYRLSRMTGVTTAITRCYLYAITPPATPLDMRTCMVLDMLAWRVNGGVPGGGAAGNQLATFFQPNATGYRWARYAAFTTLGTAEEVIAITMEDSMSALALLNQQGGPMGGRP